jgi:hypothetical protein
MTAAYAPWAAEFIMEVIGSVLYLKRSRLLSAIFYFCAMSDFALVFIFGRPFYAWASWGQVAIKQLMLIWLACSICGIFVQERRKSFTRITAAFLSLGSAAIITALSASGETLKDRLLDAEIAANMILLGMVFIGWISRRAMLDQTWKWIVAGFMLMVGSDLLFTGLWTFWDGARHWYPMGAIAAQAVWIAGPLKSVRLDEVRHNLGHKFPQVEKMRVM